MKELTEYHKQTQHLIKDVADDLHHSIGMPIDAIGTLQDQAKMLHYLQTELIVESFPSNPKPGASFGTKHSNHKILLALRAQNQFCRTIAMMSHLQAKKEAEEERANQKFANELSNSENNQ